MDKFQLAKELRERQYNLGIVDRRAIDALSDDQIINSYIECSCCGKRQVDSVMLVSVIYAADSTDHFFMLCNSQAHKSNTHLN